MKKTLSIVLVISIVLSLCSCTIGVNNTQLTMGILNEITTLDPIFASGDGETIISTNCFEGLLRFDSQGKIDLAGATAYTSERNGLSYTFKLNPSAQWYISNIVKTSLETSGIKNLDEKITAEDYIFGIKRYIESGRTELNTIKGAEDLQNGKTDVQLGVTAKDEYTLQIDLKKTDPDFLYKLAAFPVYPCDETFFNAFKGIYCTTPSTTLCNGPYYVKEVTTTESIIDKNPDYNGNIQTLNKSIVLYNTGKEDVLSSRLMDGSYDIAVLSSEVKIENHEPVSTLVSDVWGLAFNCSGEIGSSIKLRKLLSNTIQYSKIDLPEFALEKATRIIPDTYITDDDIYSSFEKNEITFTPDEEKALEKLDAILNSTDKEYLSFKFAIPEEMTATAQDILSHWRTIFGEKINVELLVFKTDEIEEVVTEKLYDVAIIPLSPEYNTCFSLINTFPDSPCFYKNTQMGKYKKEIKSTPGNIENVYANAEQLVINNRAFIPLFTTGYHLYTDEEIKGIYIADAGNKIYLHSGELIKE